MFKAKPTPKQPKAASEDATVGQQTVGLAELIEEARSKADAFIDAEAQKIADTMPGVPFQSIRLDLQRRGGCPCAQAKALLEQP